MALDPAKYYLKFIDEHKMKPFFESIFNAFVEIIDIKKTGSKIDMINRIENDFYRDEG